MLCRCAQTHRRRRSRSGSRRPAAASSSSVRAVATSIVLCVFIITKFVHGAWIVVVVIPLLVISFRAIQKHYLNVAQQLSIEGLEQLFPLRPGRLLGRGLPAVCRIGRPGEVPGRPGPAGEGRLLGYGDQGGAGRGPSRLSCLHAQGGDGRVLPRLRTPAAGRARCGRSGKSTASFSQKFFD